MVFFQVDWILETSLPFTEVLEVKRKLLCLAGSALRGQEESLSRNINISFGLSDRVQSDREAWITGSPDYSV